MQILAGCLLDSSVSVSLYESFLVDSLGCGLMSSIPSHSYSPSFPHSMEGMEGESMGDIWRALWKSSEMETSWNLWGWPQWGLLVARQGLQCWDWFASSWIFGQRCPIKMPKQRKPLGQEITLWKQTTDFSCLGFQLNILQQRLEGRGGGSMRGPAWHF